MPRLHADTGPSVCVCVCACVRACVSLTTTPSQCEKYTALKSSGKDFEMVFVSSDRDEAAFNEYHGEMTFLALPYAQRDAKEALSKHFKVSGIPSLVFVDAEGELITDQVKLTHMPRALANASNKIHTY